MSHDKKLWRMTSFSDVFGLDDPYILSHPVIGLLLYTGKFWYGGRSGLTTMCPPIFVTVHVLRGVPRGYEIIQKTAIPVTDIDRCIVRQIDTERYPYKWYSPLPELHFDDEVSE